jgi:HPt (histidine-containing phosphotransfer) domain-containing protein
MTDPLQVKMEKLKTRYIQTLPDKLAQIDALAGQIGTREWDMTKRKALITIVHRMKGSGKTFGVKGLSRFASAFEKLLNKKLPPGEDASIPLRVQKKIRRYIKKCSNIIRKAAPGKKESS